jgi:hypothetical protein
MSWNQPNVEGEPPSPRYGHSAVLCKDNMFVMGGIDSANNTLSDFHILNLKRMTWTQGPDTAKLPR